MRGGNRVRRFGLPPPLFGSKSLISLIENWSGFRGYKFCSGKNKFLLPGIVFGWAGKQEDTKSKHLSGRCGGCGGFGGDCHLNALVQKVSKGDQRAVTVLMSLPN